MAPAPDLLIFTAGIRADIALQHGRYDEAIAQFRRVDEMVAAMPGGAPLDGSCYPGLGAGCGRPAGRGAGGAPPGGGAARPGPLVSASGSRRGRPGPARRLTQPASTPPSRRRQGRCRSPSPACGSSAPRCSAATPGSGGSARRSTSTRRAGRPPTGSAPGGCSATPAGPCRAAGRGGRGSGRAGQQRRHRPGGGGAPPPRRGPVQRGHRRQAVPVGPHRRNPRVVAAGQAPGPQPGPADRDQLDHRLRPLTRCPPSAVFLVT